MRIAILTFLVSFAVVTGWLMNREPAQQVTTARAVTEAVAPKASSAATVVAKKIPPSGDVIALSDTERSLLRHLKQTVIPLIDMEKVSLHEAVDFFRLRLQEIGPAGDVTVSGLSFVIRNPHLLNDGVPDAASTPMDQPQPTITLSEADITAQQALNLICEQAGYRWQITGDAIELNPLD